MSDCERVCVRRRQKVCERQTERVCVREREWKRVRKIDRDRKVSVSLGERERKRGR